MAWEALRVKTRVLWLAVSGPLAITVTWLTEGIVWPINRACFHSVCVYVCVCECVCVCVPACPRREGVEGRKG